MKQSLVLMWAIFVFLAAKPFKNENLNPVVEEPQMPGTPVEVDEINTAPNPTAGENQSDVFRGSTINVKKSKMEQESREKDKKNVPQNDKEEL